MPIASPRANATSTLNVPLQLNDQEQHLRLIAETVNQLLDGKLNATGTFTLSANSDTTTLADTRIGPDSVILWMPTTANAGGEIGMYVSSRGKQTATITHMNDSRTDRTFAYVVLG